MHSENVLCMVFRVLPVFLHCFRFAHSIARFLSFSLFRFRSSSLSLFLSLSVSFSHSFGYQTTYANVGRRFVTTRFNVLTINSQLHILPMYTQCTSVCCAKTHIYWTGWICVCVANAEKAQKYLHTIDRYHDATALLLHTFILWCLYICLVYGLFT